MRLLELSTQANEWYYRAVQVLFGCLLPLFIKLLHARIRVLKLKAVRLASSKFTVALGSDWCADIAVCSFVVIMILKLGFRRRNELRPIRDGRLGSRVMQGTLRAADLLILAAAEGVPAALVQSAVVTIDAYKGMVLRVASDGACQLLS